MDALPQKIPSIRKKSNKRQTSSKGHLLSIKENWTRVIYSDEAKIELNSNTKESFQRPQKRNPKYTTKTIKFSLLIWGYSNYNSTRKLIKIDGTLNKENVLVCKNTTYYQIE